MHINVSKLMLVSGLALSLAACGSSSSGSSDNGGSSNGSSAVVPSAPAPVLTSGAIKNFRISWASVSGATYYRLMENPDGMSGFTQVGGDISGAAVTYDHIVPLFDRLNAQYQLDACNDTGCASSGTMTTPAASALTSAIGYLKADNAAALNFFGISVSISDDGNTLAVGAPEKAVLQTGNSHGATYVFQRDGDTWVQQAYIIANNPG
jgi:hypothetical protein